MTQNSSPATLVAIIVAARNSKDRDLERTAKKELRERFGVNLTFQRSKPGREQTSRQAS